jgi:RNA polymerase-binding transcription factor DksA
MNQGDLSYFRVLLEMALEGVDEDLEAGLPKGENSMCSHMAEAAGAAQDRMLFIPLRNLYRDRRAQIIAALARFEQETFGICVRCGEEIERERLEAIPFTPVCAPCARATA